MFSCCQPTFSPARRQADASSTASTPPAASSIGPGEMEVMMSRSPSSQILRATSPPPIGGASSSPKLPRSLFEASAYRTAAHASPGVSELDLDDVGLPQRFLEAYLGAIRDGKPGVAWVSPEVSELLDQHIVLVGMDGKKTVGKAAVIKRLEKGVETLIRMAGSDKNAAAAAAAAEVEGFEGPTLNEKTRMHECRFTLRRGIMKLSFVQEFGIQDGKIIQLKNSRK